jgi:hypothetical protein
MGKQELQSAELPAARKWFTGAVWRTVPAVLRRRISKSPAAISPVGTDPRASMTRERLDIVLKHLFFRSLDGQLERSHWEPIYRRHILERTGGVEPLDLFRNEHSTKKTVDEYVQTCESLLERLKTRGFDADYPIPVCPNGRRVNGAHRLACCLALRSPATVAPVPGDAGTWDFQWFIDRQYPQDVLADLLYHYSQLSQRALGVVIFWAPVAQAWSRLTADLAEQVGVVGWLDMWFDEQWTRYSTTSADTFHTFRMC